MRRLRTVVVAVGIASAFAIIAPSAANAATAKVIAPTTVVVTVDSWGWGGAQIDSWGWGGAQIDSWGWGG